MANCTEPSSKIFFFFHFLLLKKGKPEQNKDWNKREMLKYAFNEWSFHFDFIFFYLFLLFHWIFFFFWQAKFLGDLFNCLLVVCSNHKKKLWIKKSKKRKKKLLNEMNVVNGVVWLTSTSHSVKYFVFNALKMNRKKDFYIRIGITHILNIILVHFAIYTSRNEQKMNKLNNDCRMKMNETEPHLGSITFSVFLYMPFVVYICSEAHKWYYRWLLKD